MFFLENIRVFFGFWLDFWKKGRNQQIWEIFGVLRRDVGIPRSRVGPRRSVAEREVWTASGTPRCSKASRGKGLRRSVAMLRRGVAPFHSMKFFVFCFVLFFRCSEELSIGLMRTL